MRSSRVEGRPKKKPARLVDPAVSRWYHCATRCVRRAFLLGEGQNDRKGWIEHRLRELAELVGRRRGAAVGAAISAAISAAMHAM
jgi:hypothetical protein